MSRNLLWDEAIHQRVSLPGLPAVIGELVYLLPRSLMFLTARCMAARVSPVSFTSSSVVQDSFCSNCSCKRAERNLTASARVTASSSPSRVKPSSVSSMTIFSGVST